MRPIRIASGLLRRDPRYVNALRDRLRRGVAESCRVCGSSPVRLKTVTHVRKGKTFTVRVCGRCGHIGNPENFNDYTVYESIDQFPVAPRVGTEDKPGREYHMAAMACKIVGRRDQSVLVYGAGRSVDYRRIAGLAAVGRVAIGDVMRPLHEDAEFLDLTEPPGERFDVVVACEVIEHFVEPPKDFARLFEYVRDDGLVVCSTNIYDGGDLTKHDYLYIKGHTSYYTPRAIARIARDNGMYFDFRVPRSATTYAGPRKRYVLFTRSVDRLQDVAEYFGDHTYAPSEK
ncbi:methyltransferase domain-containing protein [Bailinhaonella thermotolerans]|uniref:Methyltransferase domain-containing protein n=1 Tax=Bailinhaonella thermotolerans TaxID=1070861 RepID=A0A3A4AGM4_9ACTN|nr:methyltransferase domain-containing protein [Bailinhaonella thermotolerans]RJL25070.1 methyltransferase domain-containing protein [Bailinhaonella thermotolerans]